MWHERLEVRCQEITIDWYCTACTRLPILSNLWTCHSSSYLPTGALRNVQLVRPEEHQTYLNHPYLASMPVSFINSTHSPLWLCCKSAQTLNSEATPCGHSAQRSAIHTTITIISFQRFIFYNLINLILFNCFIIYLIWLVIILLICACILSLSSS